MVADAPLPVPDKHPKSHWLTPESDIESQYSAWYRLHQWRQSNATKPFLARGHKIDRCHRCLMRPCFCQMRTAHTCDADFLLVFHSNEVLKPTNTGRLVADCFPINTWACTWHRTHPPPQIHQLLADEKRLPILLFPGHLNPHYADGHTNQAKRPLLVILDGTWKQAKKMYLQSPWLHRLPALSISDSNPSHYALRQAPNIEQMATVEAVARSLEQLNYGESADQLSHYFHQFNRHYVAMRSNCSSKLETE